MCKTRATGAGSNGILGGSSVLLLCLSLFSLSACGPDLPEGIASQSKTLLPWSYPDTVKVTAAEEAPPFGGSRWSEPSYSLPDPDEDIGNVPRAWLNKHDYVRVNAAQMDTTLTGEGTAVITVETTWVRVE